MTLRGCRNLKIHAKYLDTIIEENKFNLLLKNLNKNYIYKNSHFCLNMKYYSI